MIKATEILRKTSTNIKVKQLTRKLKNFRKIQNVKFRGISNFQKFKVALNFIDTTSENKKNGFHQAIFELYALKRKIKGLFNRFYRCYANLLFPEDDHKLFSND